MSVPCQWRLDKGPFAWIRVGGKRASDGDVCSVAEADSCSSININVISVGRPLYRDEYSCSSR